jgi:hypothetical protein
MTKANHERWELKLRDNLTRELSREARLANTDFNSNGAEIFSADPADLSSAPRTSLRFNEVTENIYTLCLSISHSRTKVKRFPKKRRGLQGEIEDNEQILRAIIFVMLSEIRHEDPARRESAFLWLAWRCPLMSNEGHPDQKVMDIIFEFIVNLYADYSPALSEKSFRLFKKKKLELDGLKPTCGQRVSNKKLAINNSGIALGLQGQPVTIKRQLAEHSIRIPKQRSKITKEQKEARKKARMSQKKEKKAREGLLSENTARFLDMKRKQKIS